MKNRVLNQDVEVPTYSVEAINDGTKAYAIVIPVINEGDRIRRQLKKMKDSKSFSAGDIVIVDGGSTDGSLELEFLKSVNVTCLLTKTGPGKLSAQLRCAYHWCLIQGYEGIITIDGNDKDGVETLPRFSKALDEGYGYVQASRYIKGGYEENTPLIRTLAIRLIHAPILSIAAGKWFTDTTQGYRAYSANYLNHPKVQPFRNVFQKYELLAYLSVRASQLGFKVKEIGTSRIYPANEAVPTKISGITALFDLVFVLVKTLFRRYHPKSETT